MFRVLKWLLLLLLLAAAAAAASTAALLKQSVAKTIDSCVAIMRGMISFKVFSQRVGGPTGCRVLPSLLAGQRDEKLQLVELKERFEDEARAAAELRGAVSVGWRTDSDATSSATPC